MPDMYRDQQRISLVSEEGDPRPPSIAVILRLPAPDLSHVYVGGRDGPLPFCREHFGRYSSTMFCLQHPELEDVVKNCILEHRVWGATSK